MLVGVDSRSFASLPQKQRDGAEDEVFKRGLKVMAKCYASVTGTAVITVKDATPGTPHYDIAASKDADDGAGYSGWCSFEQACSLMVTAHIATTSQQGLAFHPKIAKAEACRFKVTDISGGDPKPPPRPIDLLKESLAAIDGATFIGKAEGEMVKAMLAELEWDIRTIVEQATSAHRVRLTKAKDTNPGEEQPRELSELGPGEDQPRELLDSHDLPPPALQSV